MPISPHTMRLRGRRLAFPRLENSGKVATARNLIEETLGLDALIVLDNLGIGVYWRRQIHFRQQLLAALMRDAHDQSVLACPFAEVARMIDPELFVPRPVRGSARGNIIRRHFRRRVAAKGFVANKKRPSPRSIRNYGKRADGRSVHKTHFRLRNARKSEG